MTSAAAGDRPLVVVLDDEENMGKGLAKVLGLQGFEIIAFTNSDEALAAVAQRDPDLLMTDLRMPGRSGEEVLAEVKRRGARCEVIMMTGYGTIENALECVRSGAFDYVTKPFDMKELVASAKKAIESARRRRPAVLAGMADIEEERRLVGDSPVMENVRLLISRIAPSASSVLVDGESGTGKELAARAIHGLSPRAKGPFVAINCASIPESLMESELFGHEKGSFTGAVEAKTGLIEAANKGTLFLDEIGELPLRLQAKLLRALQEREITRVGAVSPIAVDIRIVAATNRDLASCVKAGTFREDLYYRLNVLRIVMPPLRERRGDIPVLARHFINIFRKRLARPEISIDDDVLALLSTLDWQGNVRELRNVIERLIVLCDGDRIDRRTWDLAQQLAGPFPSATGTTLDLATPTGREEIPEFRDARDKFEADYLRAVLHACDGNITEAARRSGMSRRNFYDKLEKLKIDTSAFKQ